MTGFLLFTTLWLIVGAICESWVRRHTPKGKPFTLAAFLFIVLCGPAVLLVIILGFIVVLVLTLGGFHGRRS